MTWTAHAIEVQAGDTIRLGEREVRIERLLRDIDTVVLWAAGKATRLPHMAAVEIVR
ncbi:MAG TPA: hypothetical protein VNF68_15660 [Candidatus Baltobacteraceae bacterium]|nr:hypothetical protein [Candidatus Baltobacteraceae bacterium]